MSVGIYNARSAIAQAFLALLPEGEEAVLEPSDPFHDRFLFCSGFLKGQALAETERSDVEQAWRENFADIAATCDLIFENNSAARICIIGSESGIKGSYDMAYAGSKAAIHLYIKTKRLIAPEQQLVGIAPSIISNAGMTLRRTDRENLERRRAAHPKGRFIFAIEVARLAHFLLYGDEGYISGTVIRMHGGDSARSS